MRRLGPVMTSLRNPGRMEGHRYAGAAEFLRIYRICPHICPYVRPKDLVSQAAAHAQQKNDVAQEKQAAQVEPHADPGAPHGTKGTDGNDAADLAGNPCRESETHQGIGLPQAVHIQAGNAHHQPESENDQTGHGALARVARAHAKFLFFLPGLDAGDCLDAPLPGAALYGGRHVIHSWVPRLAFDRCSTDWHRSRTILRTKAPPVNNGFPYTGDVYIVLQVYCADPAQAFA